MKFGLEKLLGALLGDATKKDNVFKKAVSDSAFAKVLGNKKQPSINNGGNTIPKKWGGKELKEFIKNWDKISPEARNRAIDIMLEEANYGNGYMQKAFTKIKSRLHFALKSIIMTGRELTSSEKSFLEVFEKFFIKEGQGNKITDWHNLASSWLIEAKYSVKQKILKVTMKRGKAIYSFYGVPLNYFLFLATANNHAGTLWWRNWFWQFSRGKYGGR